MARRLNPVQHRHHHTWPWVAGGISWAILSLLVSCAGQPNNETPPITEQLLGADAQTAPAADEKAAIASALEPIPSPADALAAASRTMQARARRLVAPADPVAVDLYTLNPTCESYQIEPIQVPRPQSMETTIGLILAEQTISDLALSGYRASYDLESKTATIDIRVARTSRRGLRSLSVCEQKALLGSLRQTLINQPDWNIDAVTFTDRGNTLVL